MHQYVYQQSSELLMDGIAGNLGLPVNHYVIENKQRHVVAVDTAYSDDEKAVLDEFMKTRGFVFVEHRTE